jgi:cytochrome c peroxidase
LVARVLSAALLSVVCGAATATELTAVSQHDAYRLVFAPISDAVPLRELHAWRLRLSTADGIAFMPTQLALDGGMPGHGHGLPSVPQATRLLPSGDLLIEGVSFNMSGRWQWRIGIAGPAGWDTATIDFDIDADGATANAGATKAAASSGKGVVLRSLALDALGALPKDPTNRVADDPSAIALGRSIFFDPAFSASGRLSCASCHLPDKLFTDGVAQARGEGETSRNTPDLVGVAWRSWFYWDGRRDSLWAQALIPFEAPAEMRGSRVRSLRVVRDRDDYRQRYEELFGALPDLTGLPDDAGPLGDEHAIDAWNAITASRRREIDRAFSNIGKVVAAFERRIVPAPGRFDAWIATDGNERRTLSSDELAGMRLFADDSRTNCLRCHNGPLFTNQGFHNIGTGTFEGGRMDFGRVFGLQAVLLDPFNCLGEFNDAAVRSCGLIEHAPRQEVPETYAGAFKVPGLRNVAVTGPYMHDGRYPSLEAVVEHYRRPLPAAIEAGEIRPIALTDEEARQLVAFLRTLDGGYRIEE